MTSTTTTKLCDRCGEWPRDWYIENEHGVIAGGMTATTHQEYRDWTGNEHWPNTVTERCDHCAQALREYAGLGNIRSHWTWMKDERL